MAVKQSRVIVTRVDDELHAAFTRLVAADERTAAQEVRRLIRLRVAENDERLRGDGAVVTTEGRQALDGRE